MILPKILNSINNIKVYAFVGPSGTGKSYRAQMVASTKEISFIIDDGLLVNENRAVAGTSAKKAPTKIETVKRALFSEKKEQQEIRKALEAHKVEKLLILGTSDDMVNRIAENLGVPKIIETIYIESVATEEEMQTARNIRITEGKHVIPVPTFEIKKDFSGFMLDPLQIFKSKGKNVAPYISEKSIIRPTFSYLGSFKISDTVFREIIEHVVSITDSIYQASRIRIENLQTGMYIYVEVMPVFGYNIIDELRRFKEKCKKEIEKLTSMNVDKIDLVAKGIHVEGN